MLALLAFAAPSFAAKHADADPSPKELAAAANNPLVQDNLAVIFAEGKGVPQDYAKAAEWFRKAAMQGDIFAQSSLAYLYMQGLGVQQSYADAAHWYYKAALQGDAGSQFHLGTLYYLGRGVPRSHEMAADWLTRAAKGGDANAKYYLEKITYHAAAEVQPDMSETLSQKLAEESQNAPQKGVGLVFLQGAGATAGAESAFYWIIVPMLSLLAI